MSAWCVIYEVEGMAMQIITRDVYCEESVQYGRKGTAFKGARRLVIVNIKGSLVHDATGGRQATLQVMYITKPKTS
jgi:hypothetical protein